MTTSGQEAGGAPWTVSDTKNLKIQGELAGGALVAKASGRVDGGNAKDFQEALETMLKDNVNTFVLNMEGSVLHQQRRPQGDTASGQADAGQVGKVWDVLPLCLH